MSREVKISRYFLEPPYKIVEHIASYGDEQGRIRPVNADVTNWHLEKDIKFKPLIDKIHENYPQYTIKELWGNTYRQGDYAKTHNHFEYAYAFVWFVDTCSHCSPLIFPDIKHPWLEHEAVIEPRNGMLYVFTGKDIHYVEPHTCDHERIIMSGNVRRSINKTVSPIDNPWH